MNPKQIVKTSYANIYQEPSFSSEMLTQALFFESLDVKSEHKNWVKVTQWDGYEGYVHKFYLCDSMEMGRSIILTNRLTPIYSSANEENIVMLAPFGSEIYYKRLNDLWCTFNLDAMDYYFKHLAAFDEMTENLTRENIILSCNELMGSPYLWGGKTPFGYDCSGFVQQVFKSMNISLKRDTSQQIKDDRFSTIELSDILEGDILFFDFEKKGVDHVGIWHGNNKVAHCGGYVKAQSLEDGLLEHIIKIKSIGSQING